jgi:hypothetical protein
LRRDPEWGFWVASNRSRPSPARRTGGEQGKEREGEYLPNPQTAKQKEVEARIKNYADHAAKKLGVSRRKFLASSGGIAASFIAMNEAHGAEFFKVSKDELFEPAAATGNAPPADLFVFDDQLHTVRSRLATSGQALRAISAGIVPNLSGGVPDENGIANEPWNPAIHGVPNTAEASSSCSS